MQYDYELFQFQEILKITAVTEIRKIHSVFVNVPQTSAPLKLMFSSWSLEFQNDLQAIDSLVLGGSELNITTPWKRAYETADSG